jgi:hypothetical protein
MFLLVVLLQLLAVFASLDVKSLLPRFETPQPMKSVETESKVLEAKKRFETPTENKVSSKVLGAMKQFESPKGIETNARFNVGATKKVFESQTEHDRVHDAKRQFETTTNNFPGRVAESKKMFESIPAQEKQSNPSESVRSLTNAYLRRN